MTINNVIAHLKMLGFKKQSHRSTNYAYILNTDNARIDITISTKRISISVIQTSAVNTNTRTNHEQGIRYLSKLLYNLEQENKH